MKVELADERIAQWVYKNAPVEDKAHALAAQFIQERHRHYCTSKKLLLTYNELAFIRPHLSALDLSTEQTKYVERSRKYVHTRRRNLQVRRMGLVALIVGLVIGFWGVWERQRYTDTYGHLAIAQDSIDKVWAEVYRERSAQVQEPPPTAAAMVAFRAVVFEGRITDAQGMPLAQAYLHLFGAETETDIQGRYRFQLVFSPQIVDPRPVLTVYKERYQSLTQSVDLAQDTIALNITLLPQ